jgi:hypothetical protein
MVTPLTVHSDKEMDVSVVPRASTELVSRLHSSPGGIAAAPLMDSRSSLLAPTGLGDLTKGLLTAWKIVWIR